MNRVDVLTPIHKGIRSMIYELGGELQNADFTDELATERIVSRLRQDLSAAASAGCIVCLLHEHHLSEDEYVFPDMRNFEPALIDTLFAEHREVGRRMAEVWKVANELTVLKERDRRIEMGDKLSRTADDLFAYYLTHLSGEEATLLPALWRHYTDEQIIALRANVEKHMSPELFAGFMSWVLPALNINELTDMFVGLKKQAPPPVLEHMSELAAKSLDEKRWAAVRSRSGL